MSWKDYECPICGKKGYVMQNGMAKLCKCLETRNTMRRLEESGIAKGIERCRFDNFEVKELWQQRMLDIAMKYAQSGAKEGKWLYFGGQSGSGKTHLAMAVIGKMAEIDDVWYMPWTIDVQALKCVVTNDEKYAEQIKPLQRVRTLFIDDMFKPVRGRDGLTQLATGADLRIAFDILNFRYINDLPTIISSEWHIRELDAIDEAISSRIYEKCGGYRVNIGRDPKRNHRYKEDEIL